MLFAKVETSFEITGKGCVIVPAFLSDLRVRVMEPIQLRTPDGHVRDTHISAVEFLSGLDETRLAFMLPRNIMKQDIPEGTEIWVTEIREQNKKP
jgi:hypothetical protein